MKKTSKPLQKEHRPGILIDTDIAHYAYVLERLDSADRAINRMVRTNRRVHQDIYILACIACILSAGSVLVSFALMTGLL